jgi:hypothetical protein
VKKSALIRCSVDQVVATPRTCRRRTRTIAHVGLQSYTFDDETEFEVSSLHAEIGALSDARDSVLRQDAAVQVSNLAC